MKRGSAFTPGFGCRLPSSHSHGGSGCMMHGWVLGGRWPDETFVELFICMSIRSFYTTNLTGTKIPCGGPRVNKLIIHPRRKHSLFVSFPTRSQNPPRTSTDHGEGVQNDELYSFHRSAVLTIRVQCRVCHVVMSTVVYRGGRRCICL